MADNTTPEPVVSDSFDENAANIIRQKVDRLYQAEPSALTESAESQAVVKRSKHQQYMYELSNSGKDLAAIQTAWHEYYQALPDDEKHQVWQEFYSSQSLLTHKPALEPEQQAQSFAEHKHQAVTKPKRTTKPRPKVKDIRSAKDVQATIKHTVTAGGTLHAKHHLQSLLFGLAMGAIVVVIFLFGLFNELVIAPFIQPSRTATATPLIVSDSTIAASATPEVIIPKINVEIPVDYTQTTTDEAQIENALESGIVHYPTTSRPGENGNAAFFGHSSNNIFNKGKYKFAFVLLHTLVPGDTFYLTYNGKVYVYKVISKDVVDPSNVGVLGPVPGQTATATLITCDPPGTSLKRLIIVGQQISPDPSGNTASTATAPTVATEATSLPGNGPTVLNRLVHSPLGIIFLTAGVLLSVFFVARGIMGYRR